MGFWLKFQLFKNDLYPLKHVLVGSPHSQKFLILALPAVSRVEGVLDQLSEEFLLVPNLFLLSLSQARPDLVGCVVDAVKQIAKLRLLAEILFVLLKILVQVFKVCSRLSAWSELLLRLLHPVVQPLHETVVLQSVVLLGLQVGASL